MLVVPNRDSGSTDKVEEELKLSRVPFWGLIGISAFLVYQFFSVLYDWLQRRYELHFQQIGKLGYWWLLICGVIFLKWALILGITLLVLQRYSRAKLRSAPPLISLLIDCGITALSWGLSAIFWNPLVRERLDGVGLRYFPNLLFGLGVLWIVIAFVRLEIFSRAFHRNWKNGTSRSG